MAKLILSFDGIVQREIPLTKERTTIGRKSHNDIYIDNLAVSGEHAAVVNVAEDYFLEDLGSTNGTLINGEPVKHQLLKNSDVIELGKYKLAFVGKSAPPPKVAEEYEKTMVWRPAAVKEAAAKEAVVKEAVVKETSGAGSRRGCSPDAGRGQASPTPGARCRGSCARRRPRPAATPRRPRAGRPRAGRPRAGRCRSARGCAGAGCAAISGGSERGQGSRADAAGHHAGQAGATGGGAHAPFAGLFHRARRRGPAAAGQRRLDRRDTLCAQGSRHHRAQLA